MSTSVCRAAPPAFRGVVSWDRAPSPPSSNASGRTTPGTAAGVPGPVVVPSLVTEIRPRLTPPVSKRTVICCYARAERRRKADARPRLPVAGRRHLQRDPDIARRIEPDVNTLSRGHCGEPDVDHVAAGRCDVHRVVRATRRAPSIRRRIHRRRSPRGRRRSIRTAPPALPGVEFVERDAFSAFVECFRVDNARHGRRLAAVRRKPCRVDGRWNNRQTSDSTIPTTKPMDASSRE